MPLGPTASRQYGALQEEEEKRQGTTPPRATGRSAGNGGVLDQISSHRPVTHMMPVMTGHDSAVTGLMGLMISDVAIRQPRHRDAVLAVRVTESQLAIGIRTARAFSYRPSYEPNTNGSYTRIRRRTLTAAVGPSPCDPYRQALTMRPSLKVRPLVS